MTYFIIAILIALYYFFAAPKSIKNTMNMISIIGIIAVLLVLSFLGFVRLMQSPPDVFVGLVVAIIGFFAIRDSFMLSKKPDKHSKYIKAVVNFFQGYFKTDKSEN